MIKVVKLASKMTLFLRAMLSISKKISESGTSSSRVSLTLVISRPTSSVPASVGMHTVVFTHEGSDAE